MIIKIRGLPAFLLGKFYPRTSASVGIVLKFLIKNEIKICYESDFKNGSIENHDFIYPYDINKPFLEKSCIFQEI